MAMPLDNDRWGYESNCYVCEQKNAGGLRVAFQLDDDGLTVSAQFELDQTYSGAPALVHGGVSLALLDECQAWACIAVAAKWALTASTAAEFVGAVYVDHPYRVEARVLSSNDTSIETEGRILDPQGVALVTSEAKFHVVGDVDVDTGQNELNADQRRLLGE